MINVPKKHTKLLAEMIYNLGKVKLKIDFIDFNFNKEIFLVYPRYYYKSELKIHCI